MDPIAHITVHGKPLCECYKLKGTLYYVCEGKQVVRRGLLKCQYDSHWDANDAATFLIKHVGWPGVESEDGPCPSARHILMVHGWVDCLVCRKRFESSAALMCHASIHRSAKEKEEFRDRLGDKSIKVKYRMKPEDAFGQYTLGRPSYKMDRRYAQYDGETFGISPDLATGERGLCAE